MMAWRLSRALACAALLLAAVVSAMPAVAADNDWDACVNGWGDFAIEPCTSAIKSGKYKDHDLAVLYVSRGIAYQDVGDLDRAMADLTEAIRLDPKYAEAYYNRGEVWLDAREFDRAIADYSEAIRLDSKHAKAYVGRGVTWQRKGDLDRAITDFTEAIRLDPNYAAAYRNRGGAWYYKGDYDRAIADCTEAIRLDPKHAQPYNVRGTAWRNKWDLERAISDYTEAIRLENRDPSDLYYVRGITSVYAGSLPAALADLNKAAELDPKSAWTALWLVITNNRMRRPNQLAQATAKLDMTKWPAPLVRLFLSQATPQAVLDEAAEADGKRWQGRLCEADFYVGATALMRAAKDEAENRFKFAVVNCPKRFTEWWTANAELRALGMRQ
jgi:lipoprotein NlpI